MADVIGSIKRKIGADSKKSRRSGCKVYLNDLPAKRILIDADQAFARFEIVGSRCDFILFALVGSVDVLVVAPIELKSGEIRASRVSRQLQGGADFAARFVPNDVESICHPILVHGRHMDKIQRKRLSQSAIHYRGIRSGISVSKCNQRGNLSRVLKSIILPN